MSTKIQRTRQGVRNHPPPPRYSGTARVDVTIRVFGITRDNFPHRVELVDEAVQAVAALDEPKETNFVRKHTLAKIAAAGENPNDREAFRNATLRVFASKPGAYQPGVNLAVYASAWKEEKDLSDIFVYWNGYAWGDENPSSARIFLPPKIVPIL